MIINYIHVADNPNATWIFLWEKTMDALRKSFFKIHCRSSTTIFKIIGNSF